VENPHEKLAKKIGYFFNNEKLLIQALTHRSASSKNNERTEFLGDSILNFIIAHELFLQFSTASEGQLSRLRALLVKESTLAEIAREIDLGEFLVLGSGELKSGGYRRDSILSDSLEAVIGAVLLDSGVDDCKKVILGLFSKHLQNVTPDNELKDPKSLLQEYLQSKKLALPTYAVVVVAGDPHDQEFTVSCDIPALDVFTQGVGTNRRRAEQHAAEVALLEVKQLG